MLIIGDNVLGHLIVNDKGNVPLVIAHPQLNSRNNDLQSVGAELFFDFSVQLLPFRTSAGIVCSSRDPVAFQKIRQIVAVSLGQTIYDPAPGELWQILQDPRISLDFPRLVQYLNMQGLSGQRPSGNVYIVPQLLLQIRNHTIIGSGGSSQNGDIGRKCLND